MHTFHEVKMGLPNQYGFRTVYGWHRYPDGYLTPRMRVNEGYATALADFYNRCGNKAQALGTIPEPISDK